MNVIDQTPILIRVPAYGEVKIERNETISYVAGDVPWVFIRHGTDNFKLALSQCLPVSGHGFVYVCNPFPYDADIHIARGLPVAFLPISENAFGLDRFTVSTAAAYRAANAVVGTKYGVGVMLRRGVGTIEVYQTQNDAFTKIIMFPKARTDFLAYKPAGCMEDGIGFTRANGRADGAIVAVAGAYTDAHVAAWVAAAGYAGQSYQNHVAQWSGQFRFEVADDTAVFVSRDTDKEAIFGIKVRHGGARQEEFR